MTWNVGDVAYIRPRNSRQNIEQLFKIFNEHNLGIHANDVIVLEDNDGELLKLSNFYSSKYFRTAFIFFTMLKT